MKVTTDQDCVNKMLRALPFADSDAGLDETAQLIRLLVDAGLGETAQLIRLLVAERDGEREAREIADRALKQTRNNKGHLGMAENMTFSANRLMDNAADVSQHKPLIDDPVLQGAILRSVKQYIVLNWDCTSSDLIAGLERHQNFDK